MDMERHWSTKLQRITEHFINMLKARKHLEKKCVPSGAGSQVIYGVLNEHFLLVFSRVKGGEDRVREGTQ